MSAELTSEMVQSKISHLNQGLLNPDNAPSWYSASHSARMGFLSIELNGVAEIYNDSAQTRSDLEHAYEEIIGIEKKAYLISNDFKLSDIT